MLEWPAANDANDLPDGDAHAAKAGLTTQDFRIVSNALEVCHSSSIMDALRAESDRTSLASFARFRVYFTIHYGARHECVAREGNMAHEWPRLLKPGSSGSRINR